MGAPSWVQDPVIFSRSVGLFIRSKGRKPSSGADWGMISAIYRKLGGRVRASKSAEK
jgi:hypothetical protein